MVSINEDGLDMISTLPDDLLAHILSLLTTKCAVITSILSTRWRHLFTLTNCLSFEYTPCHLTNCLSSDDTDGYSTICLDYDESPCEGDFVKHWDEDDSPSPCIRDPVENDEIEAARKKRFKKFVYNVLELHQVSPIKRFSLVCKRFNDGSDLTAWVSTAIQKGVEDLHCWVAVHYGYKIPDDLFMCKMLVRLQLMGYRNSVLQIPLSVRISSLKILHLEYVRFVRSVERLFSDCELLQDLTFKHCTCDYRCHVIISTRVLQILTIEHCFFYEGLFEIDAPNLTHLTYKVNIGVKIVPSWICSSSLAKAELKFDYAHANQTNDTVKYDFILIKAAAYIVTELYLMGYALELLLTLPEYEQMPEFHSLSRLDLYYCPYNAWKYLTSLIDKSPQLETIIFHQGFHSCNNDPRSPPDEVLPPFSCHAKVIEVDGFCVTEYSLLYLRYLLSNARVLKKLILLKCKDMTMEEQQKIITDFQMQCPSKDLYIEVEYSPNW